VSDDLAAHRRTFGDVVSCRVATVRPDGGPHLAPRWFVWLDDGLWVSTRIGDATWQHSLGDSRLAVLIDRGRDWSELAGVRIEGVAEAFPAEHPDLRAPMSAWHEKYRQMFAGDGFESFTRDVPSLGFLRVVPSRVDAWNHR
jgi:Pyridoxamine 5'-phosphate oxidase